MKKLPLCAILSLDLVVIILDVTQFVLRLLQLYSRDRLLDIQIELNLNVGYKTTEFLKKA